jgi:tRNA(Ile)-lysidine synthase
VVVEEVRQLVLDGGLFARDRPVVAMFSGGRDSTCLLDVALALLGAGSVRALHVNYGLRDAAAEEERRCAEVCREMGVELAVVHAGEPPGAPAPAGAAGGPEHGGAAGNLQAWAREIRYAAAARLAAERDALIATGHTANDQVETILYRLAASPGRRALLGMAPSDGRLIRPLLAVSREQTAAYCSERGLPWSEDASNEDERFARARVRRGLLPELRALHPAAEANVVRTALLLREETELLDELVERELAGGRRVAIARLREMPPALARLVVVRLAEQAAGTYVPQAGERVQEILALGRRGGRAELHVGGRAGAVIEDGSLTMVKLPPRES